MRDSEINPTEKQSKLIQSISEGTQEKMSLSDGVEEKIVQHRQSLLLAKDVLGILDP